MDNASSTTAPSLRPASLFTDVMPSYTTWDILLPRTKTRIRGRTSFLLGLAGHPLIRIHRSKLLLVDEVGFLLACLAQPGLRGVVEGIK